MVYQYVVFNENGEVVKGRLSAASEVAATELLGYAGYHVVNLKPFVPFLSLDKLLAILFPPKPTEIILFYRELAMLLESGISITTSLELLQGQVANRTLKKVLGEVLSDLRNGNQFSVAIGKYPRVFSPIYSRLLGVGEQGGSLETELRQIADYMEKEVATNKNIKNALSYPIVTSVVTIIVVGVLVTFVFPAFGNLYNSLGVDLPSSVRILIATAGHVQSYGIYLLLAVAIAAVLAHIYVRTPEGRYKWDMLALRLPLLGRVNHLSELARYCRGMSLLFHSGLPLTEVISLVVGGSGNKAMAKALIDVQQNMVKGEGLSGPMAKNTLFLPMMVQMVRVGEETGNLDTTLLAVARSYEAEAEDRIRSLTGLIQPTMTLVIGLIVGLLTISLASGMYSIYGQGF